MYKFWHNRKKNFCFYFKTKKIYFLVSKDQNDDPKKMKKVEDGLKVITKVSINTAINRSNWPIRKESKVR